MSLLPITFTEDALTELRRLRSLETEAEYLRVGVKSGGCSGLEYVLEWAKEKRESEEIINFADIPVLFEKEHLPYVKNMQIDFEKGLNARGFVFKNPNANNTCGCGSSFSV